LRIECGARTDQGRVRTSNEDYFVANLGKRIFLVADGMGGHAAGEIASRMTAEKIEEVLSAGSAAAATTEDLLRFAVEQANASVHETQKVRPDYRGMGSTLTLLTVSDDLYAIAQVGDSRAYLLRDRDFIQLTQDHSLVWPLYRSGVITKDEISRNPRKNLITRSIGTQPQVEADVATGSVRGGDLFLLCSDGLTDVLSDGDLSLTLLNGSADPQHLCDVLIDTANARGGPDNITAVIVRLLPG
jgi:protein phosphatase